MPSKKRSLRFRAGLFVGISLLVFALLFIGILYGNLPRMLERAENDYQEQQRDVVSGFFQDGVENVRRISEDIAIWEDTVDFIEGRYPDFVKVSWPDGSPLTNYRYNFLYIKNAEGEDQYVEFYDYNQMIMMEEPEGLAEHLNQYADEVYRTYDGTDVDVKGDFGLAGITSFDGKEYLIGVMPVMTSREAGNPTGTVILGRVLTDDSLRQATWLDTVNYVWDDPDDPDQTAPEYDPEQYAVSVLDLTRYDIDGSRLYLDLVVQRTIFSQGQWTLTFTTILLLAALVVLSLALFYFVTVRVARPVAALAEDVSGIREDARLDTAKYSDNREFEFLSTAINATLDRLDQSEGSLGVLQNILDSQDAILYVSDPQTDALLFMNKNMRQYCGVGQDAIGQPCWKVLHQGRQDRCGNCPVNRLLLDEKQESIWEEHSERNGRYYRNTDRMIPWMDGRNVHLHLKIDITQNKEAEKQLQKRLEQQELMSAITRSFISTENMGVMIRDALEMAGKFMDVSKILLARYDFEAETLHFDYDWYNPDEQVEVVPRKVAQFREGDALYRELFIDKMPFVAVADVNVSDSYGQLKAGGVTSFIAVPLLRSGAMWGYLIFDECKGRRGWDGGDVQVARLIANVISGALERGEMEERLVLMSSIVNSSPQYITFVDRDSNIRYANPGAVTITGYTRKELKKEGLRLMFSPEAFEKIRTEVIPQIMEDGSGVFESSLTRKDGEVRQMMFWGFTSGRDQEKGVACIGVDVTEQRQMERDLVEAREKAEQSSHAKSDFLSRMSHEMRTPLNAVIGMTAIARGTDDPERKDYSLEKIDEASNHLLGVVNDILDMSKIEAGKFELSYSDFQLERMLQRVVDVMNFRIEEKKQNFVIHFDRGIPWSIHSDEQRFAQVLTNFLSNAVKFTPEEGTVTLNVKLVGEDSASEVFTLQVEVQDTGIGISREQQSRLFQSFEQADGGISRKFGGTGLGLAISKKIVEKMGGTVWVESEPGVGSTFAMRVDVKRGEETAADAAGRANFADVRVLAVDDAPEIREYFLELAQNLGFVCDVAGSGEEAIQVMEAGGDYQIIFVDWRMPEMDGVELARRLREWYGPKAVIIMISAAEWEGIEADARAAGVDGFIPKPLFSSTIADSIARYLGPGAAPQPEEDSKDRFKGKRVLLAEDVEINREIVITMLEDTGIEIVTAEDGNQAVEKFTADPEGFDMILMDIHMPDKDGYTATREIRAMDLPRAGTIPIVAMTANVFREDVERCLAAGMNDHLGKPIDYADVMEKLDHYLN